MAGAIRQTVTVGDGGRIEFRAPELVAGTTAEVIVVPADGPRDDSGRKAPSPAAALAALEALQQSLRLDAGVAAAWADDVRAERAASRRPE